MWLYVFYAEDAGWGGGFFPTAENVDLSQNESLEGQTDKVFMTSIRSCDSPKLISSCDKSGSNVVYLMFQKYLIPTLVKHPICLTLSGRLCATGQKHPIYS